jgi:GWxTD domain-containing protein
MSFQRSNPGIGDDAMAEERVATSFAALITDEEKLNYYISALYPVSSPNEVGIANQIVKGNNVAEKQSYLYHFWLRRDMLDPESKWNEYLTRLKYVDEHFSYPKTRGYMTDRGRVYLQYGPPDHVRDEKNFVGALYIHTIGAEAEEGVSQTSSVVQAQPTNQGHIYYLPYQLWRYNRLENDFPNRVFLFWDEFRSGYYKLLNSNARGEIIMPNWERMLSQNQLEENTLGEVGQQFERGY